MAKNLFKQAIGALKSVARHSPVLGISAHAAHGGSATRAVQLAAKAMKRNNAGLAAPADQTRLVSQPGTARSLAPVTCR